MSAEDAAPHQTREELEELVRHLRACLVESGAMCVALDMLAMGCSTSQARLSGEGLSRLFLAQERYENRILEADRFMDRCAGDRKGE